MNLESDKILDYARPRFNWRKLIFVIAKIVALICVAIVVIWGIQWVWLRYSFLRQQNHALTYTPSPAEIAYDDAENFDGSNRITPSYKVPEFWKTYPHWGGDLYPLLFVHERIAPTGEHRLVAVCLQILNIQELDAQTHNYFYRRIYRIGQAVTIPGSWTHDAQGQFILFSHAPDPIFPKGIKFYSGQPDPKDPSRFTIKYEIEGRIGTVEGHLDPGGSTISFSPWP